MPQTTYRVDIYNKDFSSKLTTVVFPIIRSVNIRLNKKTTALFEVPKNESIAIDDNLKEMNKVKILRWSRDQEDHVPIWAGSIESVKEGDVAWQVGCVHLFDILDNRYTGSDENVNGVAPTEIYSLLTTVNSDDDTGIVQGTTDITDSVDFTYNRKSILKVIDEIIEDELESEFEIDPNTLELNLLSTIGEDVSDEVVFIRNDDNPQAANVSEMKYQSEGKELYNYIVGQGKNSSGTPMTENVSDATSIAQYGRREKVVTFDAARDNIELNSLAQAYLDAHKDPLIDLDITPEPARTITNVAGDSVEKGYNFWDDYGVGDLVAVKYITDFKEVERTERVVEVKISVDAASNESIQIKTTNEDQKLIAEIAARTAQQELEERIQNLENETYT